jgi:hypothetical protein
MYQDDRFATFVVAIILLSGITALVIRENAFELSQTETGEENLESVPERKTLSGTYRCVPREETPESVCTMLLEESDGTVYGLDFNLMSMTRGEIRDGQHITATGVITPVQYLSTDYWRNYGVVGIFSVTNNLVVE